ncbi:hypothetical protein [Streptomyces hirsutus]|uniref:hypothetical protein n=1 Tax=Streptomyces hirsutus TaxID=35620 RepID=UPI003663586B
MLAYFRHRLVRGVAGDVDADFDHQLGRTRVTPEVLFVPHPAENDQPFHGRSAPGRNE